MRYSVIAALTLATPVVVAWGGLGHRTVGYLAEKHLTDEAKSLFDTLLANDEGYDYSDAAVWADAIKSKMPWTRPLHYISGSWSLFLNVPELTSLDPVNDNPPKKCDVVWPTDCPDEGCVVSATFNYVSFMASNSLMWVRGKTTLMLALNRRRSCSTPIWTWKIARMPPCSLCT
jgi:hypothetical protein